MAKIILIETSTALCSVALAIDSQIVASRESSAPRAHASLVAPFVSEVLASQGLLVSDCDAVCVSEGPGSYTGLRVGSSSAKGLCFASGLPLLAVGTLDILASQAKEDGLLPEGCKYIVPMIDARRMEVYTAVYNTDAQRLTTIEPQVITADSFRKELSEGPVLFIGDGAQKCSQILASPGSYFAQVCPSASAMLRPAQREFEAGHWRNCAYFEPFYLKQYVATESKKKLF